MHGAQLAVDPSCCSVVECASRIRSMYKDALWKRRQLRAPTGDATRPTADRTRETLFSMLVSRLGSFEGLSVADLFAGSGALGLEAASRGAAEVVLVENNPEAVRGSCMVCAHTGCASFQIKNGETTADHA